MNNRQVFFPLLWLLVPFVLPGCVIETRIGGKFGYMGKDFEVIEPSLDKRSAKLCGGELSGYHKGAFQLPSAKWIFDSMAPESGVIKDATMSLRYNCISISGTTGEVSK